jgi:hypothetical protein
MRYVETVEDAVRWAVEGRNPIWVNESIKTEALHALPGWSFRDTSKYDSKTILVLIGRQVDLVGELDDPGGLRLYSRS